jgi:hypothetical protein
MKHLILLIGVVLGAFVVVPCTVNAAEPVTIDNYCRAETDGYLQKRADDGHFGRIKLLREPVTVDNQPVVRANRDTLYSYGVFDLTHPVTITMPDAGDRFMSLRAINQDHYIVSNTYDAGPREFTQESVGTRYLYVAVRVLADPDDPKDLAIAHQLQDAVKWTQKDAGKLELPDWNQEQLAGLRKAILGMGPYVPDSKRMFGAKTEVDPIRHLIGTAGGWAGGPEWASYYINVTPKANDGTQPHILRVRDVPVDGFWSITVYNDQGYMQKSESNAVSFNNITAEKDADGEYTIHFGGDRSAGNFLEIFPGWNYTVRLYRARPEALDGTWMFPEAQPEK